MVRNAFYGFLWFSTFFYCFSMVFYDVLMIFVFLFPWLSFCVLCLFYGFLSFSNDFNVFFYGFLCFFLWFSMRVLMICMFVFYGLLCFSMAFLLKTMGNLWNPLKNLSGTIENHGKTINIQRGVIEIRRQ